MSEFLPGDFNNAYLLPLLLVVMLLVLLLLYRRRAAADLSLTAVLNDIAYERAENLVIPNGDDGEIQIDHLLLTASGLLIIEIKDVNGTVFGSDKMQDWTVIGDAGRFTIPNPQPSLYDRIAAVRHIVREVPVAGRILFLDGAQFTKGVPALVCNLGEILDEFGEADKSAAKFKVDAFRQHWELLQARAIHVAD